MNLSENVLEVMLFVKFDLIALNHKNIALTAQIPSDYISVNFSK